jgi:hypothetical protein
MLRIALVYLSILTSTRTSSIYLEPQSLGNFRSKPNDRLRSVSNSGSAYEADDSYEWPVVVDEVVGSPFSPRLINANNMLHTKLSNTNRKKSAAARKSKKNIIAGSKLLYENHSKRKSSLSEAEVVPPIVVESHNSNKSASNQTMAQIDAKKERELQELFGVEGARKYQEFQLKQQLFGQQLERSEKPVVGEEVKEAPQKKRDSSLGAAEEMQDVSGAMINQMMSRTTRRQREYDVPLIRE